ncbi:hypothetical protein TI39_contig614g00016 [Zymoseptoria brevis]|uniref:F-box domain-containing protein n=1 Tax=Zymoseptoria brevis TaxID=1047168 RepID=A0A0F4GGJ6_9PEZI|nr:hypothetical protein TI39_contig614g00016 [Zymoseptoria brevis]
MAPQGFRLWTDKAAINRALQFRQAFLAAVNHGEQGRATNIVQENEDGDVQMVDDDEEAFDQSGSSANPMMVESDDDDDHDAVNNANQGRANNTVQKNEDGDIQMVDDDEEVFDQYDQYPGSSSTNPIMVESDDDDDHDDVSIKDEPLEEPPSFLTSLPNEVLLNIMDTCPSADLLSLTRTCRRFREVLSLRGAKRSKDLRNIQRDRLATEMEPINFTGMNLATAIRTHYAMYNKPDPSQYDESANTLAMKYVDANHVEDQDASNEDDSGEIVVQQFEDLAAERLDEEDIDEEDIDEKDIDEEDIDEEDIDEEDIDEESMDEEGIDEEIDIPMDDEWRVDGEDMFEFQDDLDDTAGDAPWTLRDYKYRFYHNLIKYVLWIDHVHKFNLDYEAMRPCFEPQFNHWSAEALSANFLAQIGKWLAEPFVLVKNMPQLCIERDIKDFRTNPIVAKLPDSETSELREEIFWEAVKAGLRSPASTDDLRKDSALHKRLGLPRLRRHQFPTRAFRYYAPKASQFSEDVRAGRVKHAAYQARLRKNWPKAAHYAYALCRRLRKNQGSRVRNNLIKAAMMEGLETCFDSENPFRWG